MPRSPIVWLAALVFSAIGAGAAPRTLEAILNSRPDASAEEIIDTLKLGPPTESTFNTNYETAFRMACIQARTSDLETLRGVFLSFAGNDSVRFGTYPALVDAWLRLEGVSLIKEHPRFSEVTEKSSLAFPEGYPESLRAAIARYDQVIAPFSRFERNQHDTHSHESDALASIRLLAGIVSNEPGPFSKRALNFHERAASCMDDSRFAAIRSSALLAALVRDGMTAEAVGCVLIRRLPGRLDGALAILQAALPDPSAVLTGAMARHDITAPYHILGGSVWHAMFILLPGDERVDTLISLATQAPPEARATYYFLLEKFLSERRYSFPLSIKALGSDIGMPNDIQPAPVSFAARERVLAFLCTQTSPSLPTEAAREIVRALHRHPRPQVIPALRELTGHPAKIVADEATAALKSIGQAGQQVATGQK
jgi:hypothetical protein